MQKKLVSAIYLKNGKAVTSLTEDEPYEGGDAVARSSHYSNLGADGLLIFDRSDTDEEHDESLTLEREIIRKVDIPVWGFGNIRRVEDVKKILYTGAAKAILNFSKASNMKMLEEVSKRFGKEKIGVCIDTRRDEVLDDETKKRIEAYASGIVILTDVFVYRKDRLEFANLSGLPETMVVVGSDGLSEDEKLGILSQDCVEGLCEDILRDPKTDIMKLKAELKAKGADLNLFESAVSWEELKTDENGLVPCVVQDYKNEEVLMVAYMNKESFEQTVRTGVMTYWSRSRQSLWVKGETSGHYQYIREMRLDCDSDTLLAKVLQIGAACHTGNRSCVYRTILKKDYQDRNPLTVFEQVLDVIRDRKEHPKEGSYTNYLFDKGIDKILKKCGEEAAEIIIAAKNPNREEVRYEMADFLYHMMVLMVERGLSWEDIAEELANRE